MTNYSPTSSPDSHLRASPPTYTAAISKVELFATNPTMTPVGIFILLSSVYILFLAASTYILFVKRRNFVRRVLNSNVDTVDIEANVTAESDNVKLEERTSIANENYHP